MRATRATVGGDDSTTTPEHFAPFAAAERIDDDDPDLEGQMVASLGEEHTKRHNGGGHAIGKITAPPATDNDQPAGFPVHKLDQARAQARVELAQARARINALETEEAHLTAAGRRLGEEQEARRRSLEQSLKAVGDELGDALAERTAAELRSERLTATLVALQVKLAEGDAELAQSTATSDAFAAQLAAAADEREQALAARSAAELRLERLAAALGTLQIDLTAVGAELEQSNRTSAALTSQLADADDERRRALAEAIALRDSFDRQAAVSLADRTALAAERDGLAAGLNAAQAREAKATESMAAAIAELAEAARRIEGLEAKKAEAQHLAARFEQQANWGGRQIALLVEKEASLAAHLAARQSELDALTFRFGGLQAEFQSTQERVRSHDVLEQELRTRLTRLSGAAAPAASVLDALGMLHHRLRTVERELDREVVARERLLGAVNTFERSTYGVFLSFFRVVLGKIGLRRLAPKPFREPASR